MESEGGWGDGRDGQYKNYPVCARARALRTWWCGGWGGRKVGGGMGGTDNISTIQTRFDDVYCG